MHDSHDCQMPSLYAITSLLLSGFSILLETCGLQCWDTTEHWATKNGRTKIFGVWLSTEHYIIFDQVWPRSNKQREQPFAWLPRPFKIGVLMDAKMTPSSCKPTKRQNSTIAIAKVLPLQTQEIPKSKRGFSFLTAEFARTSQSIEYNIYYWSWLRHDLSVFERILERIWAN